MNVINKIIGRIVAGKFKRNRIKPTQPLVEKSIKHAKIEFSHILKDSIFMVLGSISASFGLTGFLLPNSFIDGGVTGISLIASELSGTSLSLFIVLINIPFILLGLSTIGKQFAIKSAIGIILLALFVHFIPYPTITNDKLLVSVFGGFFLGLGIGLSVRGGAVIDGTEVLAIFVSRKTSVTIGDVIFLFNVLIFSFGAYIFSIEIALYAMLTYLAASKTVDFVISGIEEYLGITIISNKSDQIRLSIIEKLGRGCTLYAGKRGFGKKGDNLMDIDIVYTVLTRLEISRLQTEIDKIDQDAFIVMHSIKDVRGGMIKKRPIP